MTEQFYIQPIGVVEKSQNKTHLRIYSEYKDGLLGIEGFSHINVLYWLHENDTPDQRQILQVHPRRDARNPLTGVFATHSPVRPNLIALTLCRIISVQGNRVEVEDMDARNKSPIIDIKAYIPEKIQSSNIHLPDWV